MIDVAISVLFIVINFSLVSFVSGFLEHYLTNTFSFVSLNAPLVAIYWWWRLISSLYIYNTVSATFSIDLGIQQAFTSFLDKFFQFISRNEPIFLCLNEDIASPQKSVNSCGNPRSVSIDKFGHDYGSRGNSVSSQELAQCFQLQELDQWNLLKPYLERNGKRITLTLVGKVVWLLASILRLGVLFPLRLALGFASLFYFVCTLFLVVYVVPDDTKNVEYKKAFRSAFRVLLVAVGGIVRFYQEENAPSEGGVCICNHTSPMDIVIAANHQTYGWFGRYREGFLGFVYQSLTRTGGHFWFDPLNREELPKKIEERCKDKKNPPIIIYPEGTCTGSHCIMRFRKGWFEYPAKVFPIAMKYDIRYGPIFWNSRKVSILGYIRQLSSNWGVVCDMHFLPAENRMQKESSEEFAERVRESIAQKVGLKKVDIDGYKAKYSMPS